MRAQLLQARPSLGDPMDCARQAPLSVEFSKQEYWSGLQWPPGALPNPEIKSASLKSPALAGRFFTTRVTWEAHWVRAHPNKFILT